MHYEKNIYVGYDEREPLTYVACRHSLEEHGGAYIRPLVLPRLKREALLTADDPEGTTQFTRSRFLVPHLNGGEGWALFCDSDFIFTKPLRRLWDQADPKYAVMVVRHGPELWAAAHGGEHTVTKMDGKPQSYYPCKWWSALMLFNCSHPANSALTPALVNSVTVGSLHRFGWLQDYQIGDLDPDWHWLDGYSEPTKAVPAGIHFTRGTPELGWKDTIFAPLWEATLRQALRLPSC